MKIIYNSKLANWFLPSGYKAILIMCFLFCKKKREFYDTGDINHEAAHSFHWKTMSVFGTPIFGLAALVFGNPWLLILIPFTFYIWYITEWLVRFIGKYHQYRPSIKDGFRDWLKQVNSIGHEAYRNIAFEQEARAVENGLVTKPEIFTFLFYY